MGNGDGRLDGAVAIVTGSTSGIGEGIARLFAAAGASVVVTGRRRELGEGVVREIRSVGGVAIYVSADFESTAEVRELIGEAVESFGGVDVLVNCAMSTNVPWQGSRSVIETGEAEWRRVLEVGIIGPAIACQEAIPAMIRRGGGRIVTIGSVRSFFPASGGIAYDVVKAGLVNFSRQLNLDYGSLGIRSNLICPGWIVTDDEHAARANVDNAFKPRIEIMQTVNRVGRPKDIAEAALFLCSERSSFIAGAVLTVDGGLTIGTHIDVEERLEHHYTNRP